MYKITSNKKHKSLKLNTDEERWAALEKLFKKTKIKGDMFLPDEGLYGLTLSGMASKMLDWLGVKTSKRIYIDFSDQIGDAAGLYFESEGIHFILVNTVHQNNRYKAASILAHELMHFCLIGEFNFRLDETFDNEQLTDMATIYTGLGIVVLNGFEYDSGWSTTVIGLMFGRLMINTKSLSFGYYKPKDFARMFGHYVDGVGIDYNEFTGYFLPWTRHFLPARLNLSAKTNTNRSSVVEVGQNSMWKERAIQLGVILIFIPLAYIFFSWRTGGGTSTTPSQSQSQVSSEKAALDALRAQYDSCSSSLKIRYGSVDTTSQQAVDNYNSEVAACEAIRVRYNQAVDSYNAKLSP